MEELQDAIEDAQYVSAIASVDDGPRPVLQWDIPDETELAKWKDGILSKEAKEEMISSSLRLPTPFGFEWTLAHAIGFFLFSAYIKESAGDYIGINFMEEVIRWKQSKGRLRADKTVFIVVNYLAPVAESAQNRGDPPLTSSEAGAVAPDAAAPLNGHKRSSTVELNRINPLAGPPKTEIKEYSLAREPTPFVPDMQELRARNVGPIRSCVGVGGEVLESILNKVEKLRNLPGIGSLPALRSEAGNANQNGIQGGLQQATPKRTLSIVSNQLPENLFEDAELLVSENIKEKYWLGFQSSEYHTKLLNFLWFQDRTVVEDDFFVMRVLGRGGFGLVTGESFRIYSLIVVFQHKLVRDSRTSLYQLVKKAPRANCTR